MSLEWRSGRWVVVYYPNGRIAKKERFPLPAGTTEDQAREIDADLRAVSLKARSSKPQPRAMGQTVSTLFEKYLDYYRIHRSPKTHYDIRSVYRCHISPHLGSRITDKIGSDEILLYKKIRQAGGGSNNSINKELSYFSGFLKWAAREKYITPRDLYIEKLKYERPLPTVLSFDEVMAILKAADPFYRTFILCLYSLGLRLREARLLKWENIDFQNDSVKVLQKGGRMKRLPMGPLLRGHFLTIPRYPNVPYVFWNEKKQTPLLDPRKAIQRAVKKAGITKRVTPHVFRHSMATQLVGNRVNLRVVQEILGHASIETTEFYTHVALEHLRDASNGLMATIDIDG